jgi:NAD(P)-dependent dehydrogenase (short-subunit alcohol dehydrogenase family)
MRLSGSVAVISGGGRGQGAVTAELFAREGAAVVIGDIDRSAALEVESTIVESGGTAVAVHADVATAAGAAALIATAEEKFGRLDSLISNAGLALFRSVEDLTEAEWDRVVAVNLKSAFLTSRAAVPLMRRSGGGSIVTIASTGAFKAIKDNTAYAAAKAGLVQFTRVLALEVGGSGIRANCICPGPIDTGMLQIGLTDGAVPLDVDRLPLGRLGKPEEVATVSLFLCSADATFMTGAVLTVDGGSSVGVR